MAGADPLFSVILPVYNREKMARTALETVRWQTLGDWECLAVDDGSKDGSARVLQEFAATEPRVKVLVNPQNIGMNASRNRAIEQARGRFITFLDSDDLWLPGRLEAFQALAANRPEAGFMFSNAWILRDGLIMGHLFDPARTIPEGVVPGRFAVGDAELPYVTTNVAIESAAFRRWGHFRTEMKTLDTELFARFLGQGLRVAVLREALSVRRLHDDQLTDRYRENFIEAMTALEAAGGPPEELKSRREKTALEVALYMVKACRPNEARAFLREELGEDRARDTTPWRLSALPPAVLSALRAGRRGWLRLRHAALSADVQGQRAAELIKPLLEHESR
jgi:glycosyltransferase involved in cell wall biosynthesis